MYMFPRVGKLACPPCIIRTIHLFFPARLPDFRHGIPFLPNDEMWNRSGHCVFVEDRVLLHCNGNNLGGCQNRLNRGFGASNNVSATALLRGVLFMRRFAILGTGILFLLPEMLWVLFVAGAASNLHGNANKYALIFRSHL